MPICSMSYLSGCKIIEMGMVIFLFYIFVHASAFPQVENGLAPSSPITMAPPKLDNRDVSSICGFYLDSVTTNLSTFQLTIS
jgi:hypothetical protein